MTMNLEDQIKRVAREAALDMTRKALMALPYGASPEALLAAVEAHDEPAGPLPMPEGYATIFDWIMDNRERIDPARLLDVFADPRFTTARDAFWCCHRARERGIEYVHVPAPNVIAAQCDTATVNAYPVELIEERYQAKGWLIG